MELKVLYEDNHLLVAEKEVGILSQKDRSGNPALTDVAKAYLKRKYKKEGNVYLGLIHRLDRNTGGVLVLAKTSKAAKRLSEDVRGRLFKKKYLAKVEGRVEKEGRIEVKLLKDEKALKSFVSPLGKDAVLTYKIINYTDDCTYLLVDLLTGRFQQIRATFAYLGFPIVNDVKYQAKSKGTALGLWCYEISFIHPVQKKEMSVRSFPKGMMWQELNIDKL